MSITDQIPTNPAGAQQFSLSTDRLVEFQGVIKELDSKIRSASGGEDEKREAAKDMLLDKYGNETDQRMDAILPQLERSVGDRDQFIALLAAIQESFVAGEFREALNKYLDQVVAELPKGEAVDVEALKNERKVKVDLFKSMKQVLDSFGVDVSGFPDPSRSPRGAGTSAAKTADNKEQYRFILNGTPVSKSQNVISALIYQNTEGLEMRDGEPVEYQGDGDKTKVRLGTKQFKDWLEKKVGASWGKKDEWEITLPNNVKIGARRFTAQDRQELELDKDDEEVQSPNGDQPAMDEQGFVQPAEGSVTA